MKIKRTFNTKLVESVLTDPVIWASLTLPGVTRDAFSLSNKRSNIYLLGYVNEELVAMAIGYPDKRKQWYCHLQVFDPSNVACTANFAKQALSWFWANTPINELNASIPSHLTNVKNFSSSLGFKPHTTNVPMTCWRMRLKRPRRWVIGLKTDCMT